MNRRDKYLQHEFNITLEEYNKILAYQGGVCGICKKAPKAGRSLNVDHFHGSALCPDGYVMGLLCMACNKNLGAFHNDLQIVSAALKYLHTPPAIAALGATRYCAPGRVGTKKRRRLIREMLKPLDKAKAK